MKDIVKKKEIEDFIQERVRKRQPFCTLPWTKVWIEDGTKIRNCCYQIDSVGDLSKQRFQEIWNGQPQMQVRSYILRGKMHPICKCLEKVGSIPLHPDPKDIIYANDLKTVNTKQRLLHFFSVFLSVITKRLTQKVQLT